MTVHELIAALTEVARTGEGAAARVVVEEVGEGYFGDLLRVDTLMVHPSGSTLTLVTSSQEA